MEEKKTRLIHIEAKRIQEIVYDAEIPIDITHVSDAIKYIETDPNPIKISGVETTVTSNESIDPEKCFFVDDQHRREYVNAYVWYHDKEHKTDVVYWYRSNDDSKMTYDHIASKSLQSLNDISTDKPYVGNWYLRSGEFLDDTSSYTEDMIQIFDHAGDLIKHNYQFVTEFSMDCLESVDVERIVDFKRCAADCSTKSAFVWYELLDGSIRYFNKESSTFKSFEQFPRLRRINLLDHVTSVGTWYKNQESLIRQDIIGGSMKPAPYWGYVWYYNKSKSINFIHGMYLGGNCYEKCISLLNRSQDIMISWNHSSLQPVPVVSSNVSYGWNIDDIGADIYALSTIMPLFKGFGTQTENTVDLSALSRKINISMCNDVDDIIRRMGGQFKPNAIFAWVIDGSGEVQFAWHVMYPEAVLITGDLIRIMEDKLNATKEDSAEKTEAMSMYGVIDYPGSVNNDKNVAKGTIPTREERSQTVTELNAFAQRCSEEPIITAQRPTRNDMGIELKDTSLYSYLKYTRECQQQAEYIPVMEQLTGYRVINKKADIQKEKEKPILLSMNNITDLVYYVVYQTNETMFVQQLKVEKWPDPSEFAGYNVNCDDDTLFPEDLVVDTIAALGVSDIIRLWINPNRTELPKSNIISPDRLKNDILSLADIMLIDIHKLSKYHIVDRIDGYLRCHKYPGNITESQKYLRDVLSYLPLDKESQFNQVGSMIYGIYAVDPDDGHIVTHNDEMFISSGNLWENTDVSMPVWGFVYRVTNSNNIYTTYVNKIMCQPSDMWFTMTEISKYAEHVIGENILKSVRGFLSLSEIVSPWAVSIMEAYRHHSGSLLGIRLREI